MLTWRAALENQILRVAEEPPFVRAGGKMGSASSGFGPTISDGSAAGAISAGGSRPLGIIHDFGRHLAGRSKPGLPPVGASHMNSLYSVGSEFSRFKPCLLQLNRGDAELVGECGRYGGLVCRPVAARVQLLCARDSCPY